LVVGTLVTPHAALAQAVIAGSVKDTSGAVLPGVTVEASSPALIEKVRSAVSDGNGVYRIEDLRPGTYTVTYSSPASPRRGEGIVLTGSFTAAVETIDGLNVGNPPGGNQPPAYVADVGNAEEVTFSTSGGLGESETGGLTMNVVPKTGGNRISGSVFFSGTNDRLQSKKASFGLVPTPYDYIYDLNGAVGGPIKQDKIWYFVNARTQGSKRTNANPFFNLNAGRSTRRTSSVASGTSRQPAEVVKGRRPASPILRASLPRRLLLDAGFGGVYYGWGSFERDPNPTRGLTRVTEQCAAGCANNGGIAGLVYRSQDFNINNTGSFSWKANVSYVTGSHSMKVGYQGTWMTDNRTWMTNDTESSYRVSNGIPNRLQMSLSPYQNDGRAGWHAGFIQEQWSHGKLTLQGALRFDVASSWFPEQTLGPSKYFPT
jgi:hypothetical protein